MPVNNNLDGDLRQAREDANLSQTKIAEQMGVHQTRISYIENNPRDTSLKHILDFLDICGKKLVIKEK